MYLIKVMSSYIELIPQTEYASEVFLNDLMVWFLLEAPLELILTGDFKCLSLTTEAVMHLSVLLDMSACNAREFGFTPRRGRPPGEGNGNLLQYSCLEKSMDRGTWQTRVHGVVKSWT